VAALLGRLQGLRTQNLIADGSTDGTWAPIRALHAADVRVQGMKLTRNFGHQAAVLAGVLKCRDAAAVISSDTDLQDDDACIEDMVREYHAGHDVVLDVRVDRSSDSLPKRLAAQSFYRLLRLLGINVVINHADCRLLSCRAQDAGAGLGGGYVVLGRSAAARVGAGRSDCTRLAGRDRVGACGEADPRLGDTGLGLDSGAALLPRRRADPVSWRDW
jgi:hypothetical protein